MAIDTLKQVRIVDLNDSELGVVLDVYQTLSHEEQREFYLNLIDSQYDLTNSNQKLDAFMRNPVFNRISDELLEDLRNNRI